MTQQSNTDSIPLIPGDPASPVLSIAQLLSLALCALPERTLRINALVAAAPEGRVNVMYDRDNLEYILTFEPMKRGTP